MSSTTNSLVPITDYGTWVDVAKTWSASGIVPNHYRGRDGLANTMIAIEMAYRIGMSPLAVMNDMYIVNGKPSFSSKFLIAAANACGRFETIKYEFDRSDPNNTRCRCWSTERGKDERLYGVWVDMNMARAEGWLSKNGSKWKTMPELMMQYRAAAFWVRTYAPEIAMGLYTTEEVRDINKEPHYEVQEVEAQIINVPSDEEIKKQEEDAINELNKFE